MPFETAVVAASPLGYETPLLAVAVARGGLPASLAELDKLVKSGMGQADFDRTRTFLSKYVNILTKSKAEELGYAIDSA